MTTEGKIKIGNFKTLTEHAATAYPDVNFMEYKTADGIEAKTYKQLKADCDAVSLFARQHCEKTHVAIVGDASYNWAVAFLGFVNSECVVVPLAPAEKDEMNFRLAEFADCTVFCFDKKHEPLYRKFKDKSHLLRLFISLDGECTDDGVVSFGDITKKYIGEYTDTPKNDSLAAILFTSGTTSFPKGVMLTHENLLYAGTSVHDTCPMQRMIGCLPFHHAFGLTGNITKTIVYARTLCLNDNRANLLEDFRLFKPNGILAVPQIVKHILGSAIKYAAENRDILTEQQAVKDFLGGNMTDIVCGAAPLSAAENERYNQTGIIVSNGYGMTECAPIISTNVTGHSRLGSVGKPLPCVSVKIEDGEILVKGPNVMKGYYKNPQATLEAFTDDGWLKSGDLGRMDEDGYLYVTGRRKNLILLGNGENVSAEYLEELLHKENGVAECVCFGENEAIYAEILPDRDFFTKDGKDIRTGIWELVKRVNSALPPFQRISEVILRELPFERTASGKIKRGLQHAKAIRCKTAPSTKNERTVADAVTEILGTADFGMEDNFFTIGGNSLNAVELAVMLNLKIQTVYDNPVLGVLAEALTAVNEFDEKTSQDINELIKETSGGTTAKKCNNVLLTGAAGFLGIHILRELVLSKLNVTCLVRDEKAFQRNLNYYFGDSVDMTAVTVLKGDITDELLGLSREHYDSLCESTDAVFHTAAIVQHTGDYSVFHKTNVTGTKNVISFCLKADAVLHHTSTVSVHGAATVMQETEKAVFDENILDIGQRYRDNVYIHSKYRAEEQVIKARKQGLKANIYRIGNLTWRRSDGVFQINWDDNGFLHRLRAIVKLGMYHENMEKYPMDLTPVDDCANAFVKLALSGDVNRTWHLINHKYLDVRDLFRFVGKEYRYISTAEAIELSMANSEDRDIHVYLFYMIISGKSSEVCTENKITASRLASLGFSWHSPDEAYICRASSDGVPYCSDYADYIPKPVRSGGGSITPIGNLTLGVLRDTTLKEAKILSGSGCLHEAKKEADLLGITKPLFITVGFKMDAVDALISVFGDSCVVFNGINAEPTVSDTDKTLDMFIKNGCDGIIAIGGGSVLDTAKVTSLRAANPDRYIEDICKPESVCNRAVPLIMVPTTSGTGSESTLFAVVTEEDKNKKRPFTSDKFLPDVIVLDPTLTLTVPTLSTAFTGIDALSHAVESFLSLFAPYFPDEAAFAPQACRMIFEALPSVCENPTDIVLREKMQNASYLAGKAFGRIGTGYIHAIAHRLGEYCHIPHGLAIAACFTAVLKEYLPFGEDKLSELAVFCGFSEDKAAVSENAMIFISEIDKLISRLNIDLESIEINESDIFEIARKSQEEAKKIGYPRPFTDEKVREIVASLKTKHRP